jgi:uncharacterized protein (DUF58 family)
MAASASERRVRHEASTLAARLPSLVVAARQIAHSLLHGVHGRRQAGPGETFWQFRPFISGEPAARVDWRRSAREDRAFVREREWEASHTIWIWFDRSPSMAYASSLAPCAKVDRAAVLAFALADLAVRGGERAGLIGLTPPLAGRDVIERFAEAVAAEERRGAVAAGLPPAAPLKPRTKAALIGDFLSDASAVDETIGGFAARGAEGQALMIADPIEETFPFEGHTEFLAAAGSERLRAPRAQSLRDPYLKRLAAHREAVRAACVARGWGFALHRTDASAAQALLALRARFAGPELAHAGWSA